MHSDARHSDILIVSCRLAGTSRATLPLGPLYLVSALERNGRRVEFVDFQQLDGAHVFNVPLLVETIAASDSPVVGLSLFADALPLVLAAIAVYERHFGHKTFVLGGPGVNANELDILDRCPSVLAVVRGEGEIALPAVLDAIDRHVTPHGPGIYARGESGQPIGTEPVRVSELDSLAWPAYSRIDAGGYRRMQVAASRGCPFNCSFCEIITMWGRSTTFRSIPDVVAEIESVVAATGHRAFDFIDDTFTLNKRRVLDLCGALRRSGVDIEWTCFSRIDTINEELMAAMAAAGCRRVFFGIDTGSELVWRRINKRMSRAQVLDVVERTLRHMDVTASYIWGYPDESFHDFADTVTLAYDVASLSRHGHRLTTQMGFLSPNRGTPIYDRHHASLVLDDSLPLEICNGAELRRFAHLEGFDLCRDLIASDPALFAPFYHYESPELGRKVAIVAGRARGLVEQSIGALVVSANREAAWASIHQRLHDAAARDDDDGLAAKVAVVSSGASTDDGRLAAVLSAVPVLSQTTLDAWGAR